LCPRLAAINGSDDSRDYDEQAAAGGARSPIGANRQAEGRRHAPTHRPAERVVNA